MSEKKWMNVRNTPEPKCTTCGDSGWILSTAPNSLCSTVIPCPDRTKPEQVEDLMDFVKPEEYLKTGDDKIREDFEEWEGSKEWTDNEMEFSEPYKLEHHYKYSRSCGFYSGYKSALSASEKEIEELKNCLHLVVEETGHREAAMLLLTLTTRTENTP